MKLQSPRTDISRPIIDRVKESLFSVLYKYDLPAGKTVADLFCGVGSLGLEALSRGAVFVTFVEKAQDVVHVLEKNIQKGGFVKQTKVIKANAFIIGAPIRDTLYDLIFVDPPYNLTRSADQGSQLSRLMDILALQLAPHGIVIVRVEKQTKLLAHYGRLNVLEQRKWGSMILGFYNLKKDDE
jgi:16S rRNA (guanine966-N2)-methyltransferase